LASGDRPAIYPAVIRLSFEPDMSSFLPVLGRGWFHAHPQDIHSTFAPLILSQFEDNLTLPSCHLEPHGCNVHGHYHNVSVSLFGVAHTHFDLAFLPDSKLMTETFINHRFSHENQPQVVMIS
jgi:hypothetical protein